MAKIDGKYKQFWIEDLLVKINEENSITKRHHLIRKYLYQRLKQIEIIIANLEDDDKSPGRPIAPIPLEYSSRLMSLPNVFSGFLLDKFL